MTELPNGVLTPTPLLWGPGHGGDGDSLRPRGAEPRVRLEAGGI